MRKVENNGVTKVYNNISVDKVETTTINGREQTQAQLRQVVDTIYPASRGGANSKGDGLFDSSAFGEGQTYSSQRVTWIPVPKDKTQADVEALLKQLPDACIRKEISTNVMDVLTKEQINAMETGLSDKTIADYEEKRAIRDAQGNIVADKNGSPLYHNVFFSKTFTEDIVHSGVLSSNNQVEETAPFDVSKMEA